MQNPYANPYGLGQKTVQLELTVPTGVSSYLMYGIIVLIISIVILIVVHYTITPIFKFKKGGAGLIPIPGSDDSELFWKDETNVSSIDETQTKLSTQHENWSFLLDFVLDNPTANTKYPRVIYCRGDTLLTPETFTASDNIFRLSPNFNVMVYFDQFTNDLNVTITTSSPTSPNTPALQSVQVPNIPAGKAVRLGVILTNRLLEVYVNGWLLHSKAFLNNVQAVHGNHQPPSQEILNQTARVRNLRIFNGILTPAEMRAYGSAPDFPEKKMSDSCLK